MDYRGEKRSNETHESKSDPEAQMARKRSRQGGQVELQRESAGGESQRLIVDSRGVGSHGHGGALCGAGNAAGTSGSKRVTVAGDKGFDTADFVRECRKPRVTPHVAQNLGRRGGSAIDSRTARHAGLCDQCEEEEAHRRMFWLPARRRLRCIRKVRRHRGTLKVDWIFTFACAAYNLVRMRNLMHSVVPT